MSRPLASLLVLACLVGTAAAVAYPPVPADPLLGAASTDPAVVGRWLEPFDGGVAAVNLVLLDDGRLLYWTGVEAGERDHVFFFDTPVYAPSRVLAPPYTAADVSVPNDAYGAGDDLFCSGQTILADGRVLTAGGSHWRTLQEGTSAVVEGTRDARVFDPATSSWTLASDMNVGRWYPTVMTLQDGRALAASGIQELTNPATHNTLLETWDGATWSAMEDADRLLPLYPRLFVVPGGPLKGDLFYDTVGTLWGPFGERPDEAAWSLQQSYDAETSTWRDHGPSVFGARQHAASIMLPLSPDDGYAPRILTFGGTLQRSVVATGASELTLLDQVPPRHVVTDALDHPRWHLNGVLLPDGTVLAVGGGMVDNVVLHGQRSPPVLVAEQFDPDTLAWEPRAAMQVPRTYHSTALLLPDGRVIAGGHVPLPVPWKDAREHAPYQDQIVETRFEIYEPPYLHWGPRPVIATAPASVGYGETFVVGTPDAAEVVDAILVHPGATTHAWDVGQRGVVLPVQARGDGSLTFQAPPDADVAQPGPWMLFLRTQAEQGLVPSVAEFVRLG